MQHRDLVAQHEDLDVLVPIAHRQQPQEREPSASPNTGNLGAIRSLFLVCRVRVRSRSSGERLSDRVAIGVLTRAFPPSLVDDVLASTGRVEQRSRLLPARLVVYFVLAMCLFSGQGYEEVARLLTEGLRERRRWRSGVDGAVDGGDLEGPVPAGRRAGEGAVRARCAARWPRRTPGARSTAAGG